jgi:hypothetical protein
MAIERVDKAGGIVFADGRGKGLKERIGEAEEDVRRELACEEERSDEAEG